MTPERISAAAARRIAVAASGLADGQRGKGEPGTAAIRRTVGGLGLLQIDSVSVLARAHYLPLFSRLGPYSRSMLDEGAWGERRWLFEYWAHEASLVPFGMHPLLRWRMKRAAAGVGIYPEIGKFVAESRPLINSVFDEVRRRGPTATSDLADAGGTGGWWGWSGTKRALEWLFWSGQVSTATRRGFERVYDLTERVLPADILALPTPAVPDAHRELLRAAARALGIATAGDLRDYHRLGPADALPRIAELIEDGDLVPVTIRGWSQQAYMHRDARRPRKIGARALVAPFDPLVWHRPRTERLFGFRYRLEIYTPAVRRTHGYYVLPFLLGDALVARVDLKADRSASALLVLGAYAEDGAPAECARELASELRLMADWLGLERVLASGRGDLASALAGALRKGDADLC